ncbi:MAG: type II toxin-antitoxin system VapC family toxin [Oceanococcaceae bacterium]
MSQLLGVDTNVLARYYVASEAGDEATQRQSEIARKLIESGRPLMVAKTVLLELEWVLRGYYKFGAEDIGTVFSHLLSLKHVEVEDREAVERALDHYSAGLDFADALHHASYARCSRMISFDDRGFARKSKKLNLLPTVSLPR